jgi:hypothetical protein
MFGGIIGGSALGPFGSILGAGLGSTGGIGSGLGGLFGTQQGTVPYSNSFSNTFSPFASSYLPSALTGAQGVFNSGGNGLFGAAENQVKSTLAGDYLNPQSNPYLKSSVQDALGLAGSAFAGQYGGGAGNNLGNSGYQEGLARTLGQVATNAYSNAYGQERQNQLSAVPMAARLPYANVSGYEAALAPGLSFGTQSGFGNNEQPYYTKQYGDNAGCSRWRGWGVQGFLRYSIEVEHREGRRRSKRLRYLRIRHLRPQGARGDGSRGGEDHSRGS